MTVALIVLSSGLGMLLVELLRTGRRWPSVAGWWVRAIALNGVQAGAVFLAGATWDTWLPRQAFWQAEPHLGSIGAILFGYLAVTFVYYWWHRLRHEVPVFWRLFHQLHHSPARIEVIASFYKHPLEIVANGILSSGILYLLCGLSPESATQVVLITGLAELFYHWNVRTPRWLGFLFQRPESHCVHHRRGWHRQNFSDLPLWDMLFGTFHNPHAFEGDCGFGPDREGRLGAMLACRDVHAGLATGSTADIAKEHRS